MLRAARNPTLSVALGLLLWLAPRPGAAASRDTVAVWGTTPASSRLAAALSDQLAQRPELKLVGEVEAPEWFMGCTKDSSNPCVQKAAAAHKVKYVLRVWASKSGQKVASTIDLIDSAKGVLGTFDDQGAEDTVEAMEGVARRAVSKLFEGGATADNPQDAAAKAHFKAAREAYRQADYPTAIAEFEAAYKAKPAGVIRYNIAQCDEKLGDISGALLNYHRYLYETPNAEDRTVVEKAIANLEKRLAERGVQQLAIFSQPAGAAVIVDGKPRGVTPVSIDAQPGAHEVELQLAGYQVSKRKVALTADKSVELDVALLPGTSSPEVASNPTPTKPPPSEVKKPAEEGTSGLRIASYVAMGVGVVGLGVGVFENMQVSSKNNLINSHTDVKANYDSAKSAANVRNVAYIAGGAALAAGAVMFFLSPSDEPAHTAMVTPIPNGAAVAFSGKF